MVEVTVRDGIAVFAVEGVDKLWALKSRLEIPLAHIRDVRLDAEAARGWWHGFKALGTDVPGVITAGTFYQHGKRIFWDVHDPERVIVIGLKDERYDELIIEVADPVAVISLLQTSMRNRTA
jgi:hypothetical protein